jgi:hypothetical protein
MGGLFRLTSLWTVGKVISLFKAQARVANLRDGRAKGLAERRANDSFCVRYWAFFFIAFRWYGADNLTLNSHMRPSRLLKGIS